MLELEFIGGASSVSILRGQYRKAEVHSNKSERLAIFQRDSELALCWNRVSLQLLFSFSRGFVFVIERNV